MTPFALLVKPVGASCNLTCAYCFYSSHEKGVMSEAVCERLVESYAALPFSGKSVTLQGGEPLLAPRYVFDAFESVPLERAVQTNGTLLKPEQAERLKRGSWLVGLSCDGPGALNRGRGDESVLEKTIAAARLLEDFDVDYNLLAVVSSFNAGRAKDVYSFFRKTFKTSFYQFIECTGPSHEIDAKAWGVFLCDVFDAWIEEDAYRISVRLFDSILSSLLRGFPTQCSFSTTCRHYLVVEHDGSVYPCDFHVREDLRLGNVFSDGWEEILSSPLYKAFAEQKSAGLSPACRACEFVRFCQGDCPRNRRAGRSTLCDGWKAFFAHALPRLRELADRERNRF